PWVTRYSDATRNGTFAQSATARGGESHNMAELLLHEGSTAGETGVSSMGSNRTRSEDGHITAGHRMPATSDLLLRNNSLGPYAPCAAVCLHSQRGSDMGSALSDIVLDLPHNPWAVTSAPAAIY
ncbi:hypothetical protein BD311DRAFT_673359, partial [Dichomitus squalens]